MSIPISYKDDRVRAEQIILAAAERHTVRTTELGEAALAQLRDRYSVGATDVRPRVFMRITDNWVELTVRFIVQTAGTRLVKDAMSREILDEFDNAGIGI